MGASNWLHPYPHSFEEIRISSKALYQASGSSSPCCPHSSSSCLPTSLRLCRFTCPAMTDRAAPNPVPVYLLFDQPADRGDRLQVDPLLRLGPLPGQNQASIIQRTRSQPSSRSVGYPCRSTSSRQYSMIGSAAPRVVGPVRRPFLEGRHLHASFPAPRSTAVNWLSQACRSAVCSKARPSGRPASSSPSRPDGGMLVVEPCPWGAVSRLPPGPGRLPPDRRRPTAAGKRATVGPRRTRDATLVAYLAELHDHQRPRTDERPRRAVAAAARFRPPSPASRAPAEGGNGRPRLLAVCRRNRRTIALRPRPVEAAHRARSR